MDHNHERRLLRIRAAVCEAIEDLNASADEGLSVLGSLLVEGFIMARRDIDGPVASEMRRCADRLRQLADTPVAELEVMARHLADLPLGTKQ